MLSAYILNNVKMLLLSKVSKPYDPQIGEEIIGKNYAYQMISLGATGFFKDKEFNSYAGTGSLCGVFDDYNGDNFDCSDLDFVHGGNITLSQYGKRPITNNTTSKGTSTWWKWKTYLFQVRMLSLIMVVL